MTPQDDDLGDVFNMGGADPADQGADAVKTDAPATPESKGKGRGKGSKAAEKAPEVPVTVAAPARDTRSQNPNKTGEPRVLIQLHEGPDVPPGGVFIGVNGYGYTLKPGAPARVPVSVLRVLETAVVKRPIYANNADTGKIVGWSEAPRYAFTKLSDVE
jgi:hypothetical protein